MMIFFPVFPWRHAGFFEGTGEGKGILITAGSCDIGNGDICDRQKLLALMILAEVRKA